MRRPYKAPDEARPEALPSVGSPSSRESAIEEAIRTMCSDPAGLQLVDLRSVQALITDAIQDGDTKTLSTAALGLRRLHQRLVRLPTTSHEESERQGAVEGLLAFLQVASDRVAPVSVLGWPGPDSQPYRMLEIIQATPGTSSRSLQDILSTGESQVSRAGAKLVRLGLARKRKLGKSVFWEATARGDEAVGARGRSRPSSDRVTISVDVSVLPSLVRETSLLASFLDDTAGHNSSRIVLPDTQVLKKVLAAGTGGITVEQIAAATWLSQRAVRSSIAGLAARSVVEVADTNDQQGSDTDPHSLSGASLVSARADAHCVLGISIVDDRMVGVVTDLTAMKQLRYLERPLPPRPSPESVVSAIRELVDKLRESRDRPSLPPNVLGLGVELGGHIDPLTGSVRSSPNLDWHEKIDFRDRIEAEVGLSTVVENDANALALFHLLSGEADTVDTFAVILVSCGVGAGIVSNHQLVRGSGGAAGEIGHLKVRTGGEECRCGRHGCLESEASVAAMIRRANDRRSPSTEHVETLDEAILAAEHDLSVLGVFEDAGRALGKGIASLLNLLNPELILVQIPAELAPDSVATAHKAVNVMRDTLHATIMAEAFSSARGDCRIKFIAASGDHPGAKGAAAALLSAFVDDPLDERFYRWRHQSRDDIVDSVRDDLAGGYEVRISGEQAVARPLESFTEGLADLLKRAEQPVAWTTRR